MGEVCYAWRPECVHHAVPCGATNAHEPLHHQLVPVAAQLNEPCRHRPPTSLESMACPTYDANPSGGECS
jgi:hypothetical protein